MHMELCFLNLFTSWVAPGFFSFSYMHIHDMYNEIGNQAPSGTAAEAWLGNVGTPQLSVLSIAGV